MSGDLLIIVPSRGRPQNIARLLACTHDLRRLQTHVHVCVDDDDPALEDYKRVMARHAGDGDRLDTGPRLSFTAWTNRIASENVAHYRCLASFGDDHVPRTRGFDKALVEACTKDGPAIAYPWDGMREDIPEAVVVSSEIVAALKWLHNPDLAHYYVDDTWADLGRAAGCLRYLRAVAVDHAHPLRGAGAGDDTYRAASEHIGPDKAAYQAWRRDQMAAYVATVLAVRERALQPA